MKLQLHVWLLNMQLLNTSLKKRFPAFGLKKIIKLYYIHTFTLTAPQLSTLNIIIVHHIKKKIRTKEREEMEKSGSLPHIRSNILTFSRRKLSALTRRGYTPCIRVNRKQPKPTQLPYQEKGMEREWDEFISFHGPDFGSITEADRSTNTPFG